MGRRTPQRNVEVPSHGNITLAGPTVAEATFDALLTNLARNYKPDVAGLIADQVAPRIPVALESAEYPIFTPRDFFAQDVTTLTADRAPAREIQMSWSTEAYQAQEHALKVSISRRERANQATPLRLETRKVEQLALHLALAREKRVAALLRKTTNGGEMTLGGGVSNKWDVDAATIEVDVKAAKTAIRNAIGLRANTIIIPYLVAQEIAIQQDIREILKYTVDGRQILELGELILPARLWGLRVIVPDTREITSAEGQSDTYADVWGDNVRVLYVNPSGDPDMETPSIAYSFVAESRRVDRWTVDDPPGLEYVREGEILDEKLVAPDAGYEITDVLT